MERIQGIVERATENAKRGLKRTANELLDLDTAIGAAEQQLGLLQKTKKRVETKKEQYELERSERVTEEAQRGFDRTTKDLMGMIDSMMDANEQHEQQLEQQLGILRNMKERMQAENVQYKLELKLRSEGSRRVWEKLNDENKWKRENVLAVFIHEPFRFPAELSERGWNDTVPEFIRDNKDILLARLIHPRFRELYIRTGNHARPPLQIPDQFVAHKETVLALVDRYPEVLNQDVLPVELLDDKDVFRACIRSTRLKGIYYRRGLLGKFSVRIRSNADLMLEAAESEPSVFHHFCGKLFWDCSFAKRLVEAVEPNEDASTGQIPDFALNRFSEQVRSDRDVVLAYVRKNGLCVMDAVESLRDDEEIVRAACTNTAQAIYHCTSEATRRRLGTDRTFMLGLFCGLPPASNRGDPVLYRMLAEDLKVDHEIIAAALKCECLSLPDLPHPLASDRAFWLAMIKRDSTFWYSLPTNFENDFDFVRAIGDELLKNLHMLEDVFDRFPLLADDRSIWVKIISPDFSASSRYVDWMHTVIRDSAPQTIKNDRELMFCACKLFPYILEILPREFQQDRGFVEAVVEILPDEIRYGPPLASIPPHVQLLYPDLVVKAIRKMARNGWLDAYGAEEVAPELWSNLEICKAWLNCEGYGSGPLPPQFPRPMKDNEEFGLLAAKHLGRFNLDSTEFSNATSEALRSNKSFMMKAVQANCCTFNACHGRLRRDFDLAVTAFSCATYGQRLFEFYWWNDDRNAAESDFLRGILNKAEEKVNAHEGFVAGLLCGMSKYAGPDCRLPMLANDAETSLALQRMIAVLLDVPMGKDLRILRQAVGNMNAGLAEDG